MPPGTGTSAERLCGAARWRRAGSGKEGPGLPPDRPSDRGERASPLLPQTRVGARLLLLGVVAVASVGSTCASVCPSRDAAIRRRFGGRTGREACRPLG